MEIQVKVTCRFCGMKLDYTIVGEFPKSVEFTVEPCSVCTDRAMSEAWAMVKREAKLEAGE